MTFNLASMFFMSVAPRIATYIVTVEYQTSTAAVSNHQKGAILRNPLDWLFFNE